VLTALAEKADEPAFVLASYSFAQLQKYLKARKSSSEMKRFKYCFQIDALLLSYSPALGKKEISPFEEKQEK
jgi:hypothetical protein